MGGLVENTKSRLNCGIKGNSEKVIGSYADPLLK